MLPHRAQGGKKRKKPGLNAAEMLNASLDAVLLHNFEPDADFLATDDAVAKLARQKFVVALTPYDSAAIREAADLLLPIGTFAETSGTYVNVAGRGRALLALRARSAKRARRGRCCACSAILSKPTVSTT